jgi:hypothetical protein
VYRLEIAVPRHFEISRDFGPELFAILRNSEVYAGCDNDCDTKLSPKRVGPGELARVGPFSGGANNRAL